MLLLQFEAMEASKNFPEKNAACTLERDDLCGSYDFSSQSIFLLFLSTLLHWLDLSVCIGHGNLVFPWKGLRIARTTDTFLQYVFLTT